MGDFLEYLGRDHNWILDSLDIWQIESTYKRIQAMKLKEKKEQQIMFAQAISGMNGVKFPGAKSASQYWRNEILEQIQNPEIIKKRSKDGLADEREVNAFLSMFGSGKN